MQPVTDHPALDRHPPLVVPTTPTDSVMPSPNCSAIRVTRVSWLLGVKKKIRPRGSEVGCPSTGSPRTSAGQSSRPWRLRSSTRRGEATGTGDNLSYVDVNQTTKRPVEQSYSQTTLVSPANSRPSTPLLIDITRNTFPGRIYRLLTLMVKIAQSLVFGSLGSREYWLKVSEPMTRHPLISRLT